ncbi:putative efflux protein, MATE family [Fervidobacterium changbaicum]|uniref:Multidrug-efflux transporter n=1 Tax=Fervidobacterium changbaicum TaxID=310769 RepID=A0ABX5QTQ0_9BACT|nr:MATE family efflux transporter [Fervidobacterium changbaicum]QAV33876.1 MATE family efflux transporter [Fervidobacterium changbaicum]SDH83631.1 putative efflux protein, MATE family [Fervidobacterium changbaicum]
MDNLSEVKDVLEKGTDRKTLTRNLFKLSVPGMIGFAVQSLYDIIDMFWIGKISYKAIAGVVIFSTIFWLVEILNEIIGTSSVSLISQAFGKGDKPLTSRIIEQTLVFKALVALIASGFLLLFFRPIVNFFSKDLDVVTYAIHYGYIRIFFMPIFFMTYSTFTALRNVGHATLATLTMASGAVANILLDPVFIFEKVPLIDIPGLGLGVSGAAWATVISTFVPLTWGIYVLFKGISGVKISLKGLLSLDKSIDKKLITIGLPSGIEMLLRNLSYTVLIKISSLFGSEYVTVFGINERMFGFAIIPIFGLSMGASTLVGFQLGRNNEKAAKEVTILATFYSVTVISAILMPLIFLRKQIFHLFTSNETVMNIGMQSIPYIVCALFFISFSAGLSSAFFGSGKTSVPMVSGLVSRWGVMVPFVFISSYLLRLGPVGLWLSFPLSELAEVLIMWIAFVKSDWHKKRVV